MKKTEAALFILLIISWMMEISLLKKFFLNSNEDEKTLK